MPAVPDRDQLLRESLHAMACSGKLKVHDVNVWISDECAPGMNHVALMLYLSNNALVTIGCLVELAR